MGYKICSLRNDGWPMPQQVAPTRLLDALMYIDEYHGDIGYNDIKMLQALDKSFEPLIPVRETRYDKVFEHIDYSNLLTDMLLYWDEYWDDWEYYDPKHRANMNYIDEADIFKNYNITTA